MFIVCCSAATSLLQCSCWLFHAGRTPRSLSLRCNGLKPDTWRCVFALLHRSFASASRDHYTAVKATGAYAPAHAAAREAPWRGCTPSPRGAMRDGLPLLPGRSQPHCRSIRRCRRIPRPHSHSSNVRCLAAALKGTSFEARRVEVCLRPPASFASASRHAPGLSVMRWIPPRVCCTSLYAAPIDPSPVPLKSHLRHLPLPTCPRIQPCRPRACARSLSPHF